MASISSSAMTEEYERIIQPLKDAPARAATWVLLSCHSSGVVAYPKIFP